MNGHCNGHGRTGESNAGNGAARSVTITVNGHTIDLCAIAQMTPAELVILSADMRKAGWPAWQAQLLTGANLGYVSTAYHLTRQQRQMIDNGQATLAQFHNSKKRDREVEDFLKRPSIAARVLAVLHRMTAPLTSVPAE